MKKALVSVAVVLCGLCAGRAWAQHDDVPDLGDDSEIPRHAVTINPLGILFGSLDIEIESALRPNSAWFWGPSFAYASSSDGGTSNKLYGAGATVGVRGFSGKRAPAGFWGGPQASLMWITGDVGSEASASAVAWSLGALVGYTWIFDNGFVLSLGGGMQYIHMQLEAREPGYDDYYTMTIGPEGILPTVRLALGLAN